MATRRRGATRRLRRRERRGRESNPRVGDLQSHALPLGYPAERCRLAYGRGEGYRPRGQAANLAPPSLSPRRAAGNLARFPPRLRERPRQQHGPGSECQPAA